MSEFKQADKDLFEKGADRAEARLKQIAESVKDRKEFADEMNALQIEATHTLALLILNSWLMRKDKSADLFSFFRVVTRGLEAEVKALGESEADGKLQTIGVGNGEN